MEVVLHEVFHFAGRTASNTEPPMYSLIGSDACKDMRSFHLSHVVFSFRSTVRGSPVAFPFPPISDPTFPVNRAFTPLLPLGVGSNPSLS